MANDQCEIGNRQRSNECELSLQPDDKSQEIDDHNRPAGLNAFILIFRTREVTTSIATIASEHGLVQFACFALGPDHLTNFFQ